MKPSLPWRLNLLLAGVFVALAGVGYVAVPLLLPRDPAWALLLLVPLLATTANWALIHEGIHGLIHPRRGVNDAVARMLSVLFGGGFRLLRFGHLLHHVMNRTELDRSEVYRPEERPPVVAAGLYYFRLTIGLFLAELAGTLALLLPRKVLDRLLDVAYPPGRDTAHDRARALARRHLFTPEALRESRLDALALVAVLAGALALYGEAWPVLVAFLATRGVLVSLVDNSFHYGTPLNDVRYAYNLRLPPWLARGILNFNLHRVHHQHAGLPWTALPGAFARDDRLYDLGFFTAVGRQWAGPIPERRLAPSP